MTSGAEYLRNPVPVEARQLHRYNAESIAEWIGGTYRFQPRPEGDPYIAVELQGTLLVTEGEWVVKEPNIEERSSIEYVFTRVTDEEFQSTYTPNYPEPVGEHVAEESDVSSI